jgi:hypothetical protein
MSDDIEFGQPPEPAPRGARKKWSDFVAGLRAQPGEWGRLPYTGKHPATVASTIRRGNAANAYSDFTPREEFEVRQTGGEIWIRHVPPGSPVGLGDEALLEKFFQTVEELNYGEVRPYDEVEAEVDLMQVELKARFGESALDNSAYYFTRTKASDEDMIRMAREEPQALIHIMRGGD